MIVATFSQTLYNYYTDVSAVNLQEEGIDLRLIDKHSEDKESCKVLISGRLKKEQLERFPELMCVVVPYTGLNGLDVDALRLRKIKIINTNAHAHFVAERAMALLLALQGKLVTFHNGLVNQQWHRSSGEEQLSWKSIYNKKVAVYGYGTIGSEVGKLLKPWHVSIGVLSYKGREHEEAENFDGLKQLCEWCDILIVTIPLTELTVGSINDALLKNMHGKYIVNVGRGSIIEEKAIYDRLKDGTLGGFASDVWYLYPTKEQPDCWPSKYPVHALENVVMTPHNAGFEETSSAVRSEDVLRQIIEFMHAQEGNR